MPYLVYFVFRFKPPILDEALLDTLRVSTNEQLRERLRIQSEKEWADARVQARPFAILSGIALLFAIVAITGRAKGMVETSAIAAVVGVCVLAISGGFSAASLYKYQWRRRRWFMKAKRDVDAGGRRVHQKEGPNPSPERNALIQE